MSSALCLFPLKVPPGAVSGPLVSAISCEIHLPETNRVPTRCIKDTLLPLGTPIVGVDGKQIKEIFVPRGTVIAVSIVGTNRNHEIWGDDAREWKPERWLGDLPESVKESGVPGAYSSL